jgi:hypothetical protein
VLPTAVDHTYSKCLYSFILLLKERKKLLSPCAVGMLAIVLLRALSKLGRLLSPSPQASCFKTANPFVLQL